MYHYGIIHWGKKEKKCIRTNGTSVNSFDWVKKKWEALAYWKEVTGIPVHL